MSYHGFYFHGGKAFMTAFYPVGDLSTFPYLVNHAADMYEDAFLCDIVPDKTESL